MHFKIGKYREAQRPHGSALQVIKRCCQVIGKQRAIRCPRCMPCGGNGTLRKAMDPMHPGAKRQPSSLVKATTSTGLTVSMPLSSNVSKTSKAQSVPSAPSNRPPEGWLSRWLPISSGGKSGFWPSRRGTGWRLGLDRRKIHAPGRDRPAIAAPDDQAPSGPAD